MSGKMDYILVCRCPTKCVMGLKEKNAERNKAICYNCRHSQEIPEQKLAGLGRM